MNKRRIGVRAIIYEDGKILGVRHKSKDGKPKNWWAIPGGGLDPGESLEDGLKREIMEELGVAATPGRLLFIQQFNSGRADCNEELEFFFLIENPSDFVEIDFSNTSHGLEELSECRLIDPKIETVLPSFICGLNIRSYVEAIQPVLVSNQLSS